MKNIAGNFGIVVCILGVIALVVHQIEGNTSNGLLFVGIGLLMLGLIAYVLVNKYIEN